MNSSPVRWRCCPARFGNGWTVTFRLTGASSRDAAIGAEVGDAVRARHRLPASVETLVHRLIRDVGIVPADVASGTERLGAASAWISLGHHRA